MLVHHLIQFFARSFPDELMVSEVGRRFSFVSGNTYINRIVNLLQATGLSAGDRVAVLGENSADHIMLFFAAGQLGVVLVPLNFRLAVDELEYIVRDAEATLLVVTDSESLKKAEKLAARIAAMEIYSNFESESSNWNDALDSSYDTPCANVESLTSNNAILQLYTSGTTGRPKGVVLTHQNLLSLSLQNVAGLLNKPGVGTRELIIAPLFHVGGLATAIIALIAGGGVVLHRAFDPGVVADTLEHDGITAVFMVPLMIQALINGVADIRQRDFSRLKRITYGAAPISEGLLNEALLVFDCEFVQYFGQTETCGGILSLAWPDHQKALAGQPELLRSCGRSMAGVSLKVCDEDGNELSNGETGEFVVRSGTNMISYWKLPQETHKTLKDGWIHTGDAGYVNEDGYAFLRDRIKDMVVTGGENVYPVEVESVLSGHPSILELAVIGVPDEKFGEALLAVVALKPGASLTQDELLEFSRDKIAGFKIPRQLKIVDALPRNASGKVLKTVLREPYWAEKDRSIG
jgi:acyl-CoA synthetase (AMP-forming)/AMP-acid ligase II